MVLTAYCGIASDNTVIPPNTSYYTWATLTTTTYRNKLVTDIPNPLTAPNLSGVTELFMNSAWHTKQLAIATLMMTNIINRKVHKTAGLEEYKHTTIIQIWDHMVLHTFHWGMWVKETMVVRQLRVKYGYDVSTCNKKETNLLDKYQLAI